MAIEILAMYDLIKTDGITEDGINSILRNFVSRRIEGSTKAHDVEEYLHTKAIEYERSGISRTYLVFDSQEGGQVLAGYFTIANKNLVIAKKSYKTLSTTMKRRLMGFGYKTEHDNYNISAILIGQIGKNYSEEALALSTIDGSSLLNIAMDKVLESHRVSGGRIVYLECENHQKLKSFYARNSFLEIPEYQSTNGLCVMIRKLSI